MSLLSVNGNAHAKWKRNGKTAVVCSRVPYSLSFVNDKKTNMYKNEKIKQ